MNQEHRRGRFRNAGISLVAVVLIAGAGGFAGGVLAASKPAPLSAPSLLASVRRYASQPDHLSGTPRSYAVTAWIATQLRSDGLQTGSQAFAFDRFLPVKVSLSVGSRGLRAAAIAPLFYSGRTGSAGLRAPLADGGTGTFDPATVRGKIVVVSISYLENALAVGLPAAIEAATKDGAKALVVVSQGPADYPRWEDVDARGGTGHLPVLIVGKRTGQQVIEAAKAGSSARLILEARVGTACDRDVWGELPGRNAARHVIIGTPASSYVPAASERGSGIAVLLDLARHYARLPRSKRPETLVFVATTGHEIGFLGLPALIEARPTWFKSADAYVHLGASIGSPEMTERPDGGIDVMPVPDPSGSLYDSENPLLAGVPAMFARAGASLTSTQPHVHITGEQAYAYHAGVPLVSFSGASLFFHTAGDLPNRISPSLLPAEALGFERAIDTITALPAGRLKAANGQAAAYGAKLNPNPTPQGGSTGPQRIQLTSHCG